MEMQKSTANLPRSGALRATVRLFFLVFLVAATVLTAAERPPVMGRNAGVSAGHPLTTATAFEILTRGGNAFDAGVAAMLTGGVVEQDLYSLGGEGLVLVYPQTGKKVVPGGSQRIDMRWGANYIQRLQGSISDGVLTTEPADLVYPWAPFELPTDEYMRAARLRLKLTPTTAEGLIGGYTDVETWYLQMVKSWSTHHQNYGQTSAPSLYRALRRLADAYPDPKTRANTAISSALRAEFTQVVVVPSSRPQSAALAARHPPEPYRGPPFPRPPQQPAAAVQDRAAPVAAGQ